MEKDGDTDTGDTQHETTKPDMKTLTIFFTPLPLKYSKWWYLL